MSIYMRVIFRDASHLRLPLFKQVEQLHAFKQRLRWFLNRAQNFSVRQFLRNNHRDVARDRWIAIEFSKFFGRSAFIQKEIGIQLGNKD